MTKRPISDQVVVVTGAAKGIGRETAVELERRRRRSLAWIAPGRLAKAARIARGRISD